MTTDATSSSSQSGIFSDSGELGGSHPQFTEICTALYERELLHIAHCGPENASILRRRLAGLPHHIRSVARFLVTHSSPLEIDAHNGSWFTKQPGKCPGETQQDEKKQVWFTKNSSYGLVVPVMINTLEGKSIELDSIDNVNTKGNSIHTNKHGWFVTTGRKLDQDTDGFTTKLLLKPTMAIMASACSGHTWRHKSKSAPRALSLREMRLSTQIDWKNFTLKGQPSSHFKHT